MKKLLLSAAAAVCLTAHAQNAVPSAGGNEFECRLSASFHAEAMQQYQEGKSRKDAVRVLHEKIGTDSADVDAEKLAIINNLVEKSVDNAYAMKLARGQSADEVKRIVGEYMQAVYKTCMENS